MNCIYKTFIAFSFAAAISACSGKSDSGPEQSQPEPKSEPVDVTVTEIASAVVLGVSEPSSLTWNKDKTTLYVVSDGGEISEIRPATGVKKSLIFNQKYDWEGICMDRENDVLYAIQEKGNKIYSLSGAGYKTFELFYDATIPGTQDGSDNYGCEGLEYADGVLYLGNQHNPCLVQTVNAETKEVIANIDIPFATFISDLCYDAADNTMWILESNAQKEGGNQIPKLYNCTLPDFTLRYTITLPAMVQAEGLEIDRKNSRIYVCCDNTSKLYTLDYTFQ